MNPSLAINGPFATTPGPESLRASLLTLILRVTLVLGAVVYVPSAYLAFKHHLFPILAVDTISLLAVVALLQLDCWSVDQRATPLCLIYYALGVALLIGAGSIGQIYLIGFCLVTTLLLGMRTGVAASLLSSVTVAMVGVLGHSLEEMVFPSRTVPLSEILIITINFTVVSTLLALAVGTVRTSMNSGWTSEIATRRDLDRERVLLRTLIDTLPDVVFTKDEQGRFVTCNRASLSLFGPKRSPDEVLGKTVFDLYPPQIAAAYEAADSRVMTGESIFNHEEKGVDSAGQPLWHLITKIPLRNAAGDVTGLLGIARDVTQSKLAESAHAQLLGQLQLQIERMPLAYMLSDRSFRYVRWNPAAERTFGFSEIDVLGKHPSELIVPSQSQALLATTIDRLRAGSMDANGELENVTRSGELITCEWHHTPLFDDDGTFVGLMSLSQDITARKKLEEQLRHSQRLEAFGQLAGGVAHDFNNLLSVVLSYSNLVIDDLPEGNPIRADVEEIQRASRRAADLTRQLLMFSRQQVLAPRVLDLNDVLSGAAKMLRVLLGEDVALTSITGDSLWRVRADPGSIEQVIVNLAVNARDAMPTGGKLTIETSNVVLDEAYTNIHVGATPGPHVMLAISDTGVGMDKQTLAKIFEPFFTTKERGKGTGLGLSTAFGIVQQCGGAIWAYSEVGIGTTFKIYLPRVDAETDGLQPSRLTTPQRGCETILVVEDEEQVRDVACGILRRSGYNVLEARSAGEALIAVEQCEGTIDLLVSDVVMPQMNGPTLAKRLAGIRPAMKVLYMSGYTDDAAVRHGVIKAEFAYLQKPFTAHTLTSKVREVLDGDARTVSVGSAVGGATLQLLDDGSAVDAE